LPPLALVRSSGFGIAAGSAADSARLGRFPPIPHSPMIQVSIPGDETTAAPIHRAGSLPNLTGDSAFLVPNPLHRVARTQSYSQASPSSPASTNLRDLQGFPVAHRLTTFAQDLFIDTIYQEAGGGWKDDDDIPTVQRLSGEMSVEVADSQSHEHPTEEVEEGSSIFIFPLAVD
jgi:hypothetical protein